MAAPSSSRAAARSAIDVERAICDAAKDLAIFEKIDYSLARRRIEAQPERHLSREVVETIRYARTHLTEARSRFLQSLDNLRKWAEENGISDVTEMVRDWVRTTGGGSVLTRTSAEQQKTLDAGAAKFEAESGVAARRNAAIGRPAA